MKVLLLLTLMISSDFALACRCAEQTMAEYFASADEVFMATLLQVKPTHSNHQIFEFDPDYPPYKRTAEGASRLPYVSHLTSAACAVRAEPGAVYAVFAQRDEDNGVAWMDSCNGTRVHRGAQGEAFDFQDIPAKFVVSQLSALAGLDALRKIARAEAVVSSVDNTSMVGLLDVAAFAHTDETPIFGTPGGSISEAVRIRDYDDLQHRESGYESDAAVVFAVVDQWYKIRLQTGDFGWLAPDAAGTFWPLETLLPGRLAYLTKAWNRLVWPDIGAGIPLRLSHQREQPPREQAVRIIRSQRIAGSLWFEIEALQSNACEGKPEKVLARGWVPAYTESGEPVAWFYSRGC